MTSPRSSTRTVSKSVAPSACATPPSTWPRHCIGFITLPASAAWTLRRMRISPVSGSTARRNHWALKATERGEPPQWPSAATRPSRPAPRPPRTAPSASTTRPAQSTASAPSTHRWRATPVCRAAKVRSRSASEPAASRTALPATTVPGGAERAGVVADDVGVGLPDREAVRGGVQRAGGDLRVHGGAAVAELGRADGDLVRPVGQQRHAWRRRSARRAGRSRSSPSPCPGRPASPRGPARRWCPRRSPCARPPGTGPGRTGDVRSSSWPIGLSMCSPGPMMLFSRKTSGSMPRRRASSSMHRLDGEGDLAQAVAAEGARRDGVRVDGERVDPLVRGAVDGERLAAAVEHDGGAVVAVGAGVGDDAHLASRSACRRRGRRP